VSAQTCEQGIPVLTGSSRPTWTVGRGRLAPPLVADLAGTHRAIWDVLAGLLALAFIPASLVHEHDRVAPL
jgi:hypothetical protein